MNDNTLFWLRTFAAYLTLWLFLFVARAAGYAVAYWTAFYGIIFLSLFVVLLGLIEFRRAGAFRLIVLWALLLRDAIVFFGKGIRVRGRSIIQSTIWIAIWICIFTLAVITAFLLESAPGFIISISGFFLFILTANALLVAASTLTGIPSWMRWMERK